MVNVPRIHCHSAFKHYEMFHCNYGSSYGNSIFNTTYNFNGGMMCGGGFWGGLLGGLGMGLGAGLMSFLGGGLFGGTMGMFGGGMNMFGGFPMMNWWGGSSRYTDGAGGKDKVVEKEITDRDNEVLKNLENDIQAIEKKAKEGTLTEKELEDIKKKVDDESKLSDKYHKKADDEHYELLKNRLNLIKIVPSEPVPPEPPVVPPDQNEAVNVTLQFARHDGNLIKDANIKGSIVGVKMAADGKTTAGYIIDCNSDTDSKFKLKYEVTINNNGTYNIKCISRTHSTEDCKKKLYTPADGIDFKKVGNLLVRVTNSDEPLVSEYQKEGYKQEVEYSEKEESFELPPGYKKVEDGETEIDGKKFKINV